MFLLPSSDAFQSTPPRGKRLPRIRTLGDVALGQIEFQSTPPRGKRLRGGRVDEAGTDRFNPRPRAGSDSRAELLSVLRGVSIHAPAREATRSASRAPRHCPSPSFNPRPRAGSDLRFHLIVCDRCFCFNPRPRAGSDPADRCRPARVGRCFNPRPRAGSDTVNRASSGAPASCFNPRPRAGSDLPAGGAGGVADAGVSIHAPAREATRCARHRGAFVGQCCFNPRPRAGSDQPEIPAAPAAGGPFQSTPPRGKRPAHFRQQRPGNGFNPRPRAGSDQTEQFRRGGPPSRKWFQSTPPRGKRLPEFVVILAELHVSIHAPAREATLSRRDGHVATREFQSTPPRGKRPQRSKP